MKLHLTRTEMLARWRACRGFDPMRSDSVVTRTDGMDFDMLRVSDMNEWYGRLLREAPAHLLAPETLGMDRLVVEDGPGCRMVRLPEGTVRVISVTAGGWEACARLTDDPSGRMARRQRHPYTRACAGAPVAVFDPSGPTLRLYPCPEGDVEVTVVVERPSLYELDEAAFEGFEWK